jgi:hypothetical protein
LGIERSETAFFPTPQNHPRLIPDPCSLFSVNPPEPAKTPQAHHSKQEKKSPNPVLKDPLNSVQLKKQRRIKSGRRANHKIR